MEIQANRSPVNEQYQLIVGIFGVSMPEMSKNGQNVQIELAEVGGWHSLCWSGATIVGFRSAKERPFAERKATKSTPAGISD